MSPNRTVKQKRSSWEIFWSSVLGYFFLLFCILPLLLVLFIELPAPYPSPYPRASVQRASYLTTHGHHNAEGAIYPVDVSLREIQQHYEHQMGFYCSGDWQFQEWDMGPPDSYNCAQAREVDSTFSCDNYDRVSSASCRLSGLGALKMQGFSVWIMMDADGSLTVVQWSNWENID